MVLLLKGILTVDEKADSGLIQCVPPYINLLLGVKWKSTTGDCVVLHRWQRATRSDRASTWNLVRFIYFFKWVHAGWVLGLCESACARVCTCVHASGCVCVCVCERERERGVLCISVCVCVVPCMCICGVSAVCVWCHVCACVYVDLDLLQWNNSWLILINTTESETGWSVFKWYNNVEIHLYCKTKHRLQLKGFIDNDGVCMQTHRKMFFHCCWKRTTAMYSSTSQTLFRSE